MTRVQPTPGIGPQKPKCGALVRLSERKTITRAQREMRARETGLAPEVCGRRATHLIDGRPLCLAHAGLAALLILASEGAS